MTTAGTKNRILVFSLIVGLLALPVGLNAQDDARAEQSRTGLLKIIIGASMTASGALMAATSGESAEITATDPFFGSTTIKASSRSTGRLVLGLGLLGSGGFLIWDGNRDRRQAASPSANLRFRVARRGAGFVFSRSW